MKRYILFVVMFLTISVNVFSKIQWFELTEELKENYTAMAACTTKAEVLEITHVTDLEPYFITYKTGEAENKNDYSVYIVAFTSIGFVIEEYLPHSKTIAYYAKTIFQ